MSRSYVDHDINLPRTFASRWSPTASSMTCRCRRKRVLWIHPRRTATGLGSLRITGWQDIGIGRTRSPAAPVSCGNTGISDWMRITDERGQVTEWGTPFDPGPGFQVPVFQSDPENRDGDRPQSPDPETGI